MRHDEHSWTTFDGLAIHAQAWLPTGEPRAAVALVHGLGDHSGRYPRLVELLTEAGYAISAFDERGHGKSGGPRVYAPSYEALMKDIDSHLEKTRARFPRMPIILYGHSHGGAQVLYYALSRTPSLSGVVASSPSLKSGVPQSGFKILAARTLSRIVPTMRIPLGSPLASISHDPAWLETSTNDPLFQEGISVRLGVEILHAGQWIKGHDTFPLPLLLMQGTEDQHVDAATTIAFAKRLPGDVTLKVWEGMGHELHNEVIRDEVIGFLKGWLDSHTR